MNSRCQLIVFGILLVVLTVLVLEHSSVWNEYTATSKYYFKQTAPFQKFSGSNNTKCRPCESEVLKCKDFLSENNESNNQRWGTHKLAVLVPYRNAFEELLVFAPHVHHFIKERKVRHEIIVVHQVDTYRFNKGALLNVGYLLTKNDFDYLAIHDIDILPINPLLNYSYPEKGPYHMSSPEYHPQYHGKRFIGGVILFTYQQFKQIRGMTNQFWGWGGEDNELYTRIKTAKMQLQRTKGLSTGNKTFRNIHDNHKRPRDKQRFDAEKTNVFKLDDKTGFHNVNFTLRNQVNLMIQDAPVTMYNIQLVCDSQKTPWCKNDYKPS